MIFFYLEVVKLEETENLKNLTNEWIRSKNLSLVKLALQSINLRYDELKNIFWNLKFNPFSKGHAFEEVYSLIKNNCLKFNENEIDLALNWIRLLDQSESLKSGVEKQENAYNMKEYLSSLEPLNHPKVQKLYKHFNKINPEPLRNPGRKMFVESYKGPISPISEKELAGMEPEEIINFVSSFKGEKGLF